MSKALHLVSTLLEADPDEVDPREYVRGLPPREPRMAYALLPLEMTDPTIQSVTPIVVKEGETGYWKTDYSWRKEFAEETLNTLNRRLGLSPEEADQIFIQSMFPPKPKRKLKEALRLMTALLETDPDLVDPVRYLKDLTGPDKRIRITFSRTTPESAAEGDFSSSGWINEEGVDMTPDLYDVEEGVTAVDKAVKFLRDEGVSTASSSRFSPGDWFSTEWQTIDYRTGEDEERSFHLVGFTPEEQIEIHDRLFKKGN
jgi:hypothetical protein